MVLSEAVALGFPIFKFSTARVASDTINFKCKGFFKTNKNVIIVRFMRVSLFCNPFPSSPSLGSHFLIN